ncbi:MAG: ferritin-like domain-containing protein [Methylocella sp.]
MTPAERTVSSVSDSVKGRREFLRGTAAAAAGIGALMALTRNDAQAAAPGNTNGLTQGDLDIVSAAQIAEALAVATYTNIIHTAPFFTRLQSDDKRYLKAARQEEMSHYLLEKSVTNKDSPFTKFFYPKNMFANAQVTLNTLVTLEEAFIAAYLVGVRRFSNNNLKVTAARIMGIESDHRTLARVIAPGVAVQDGGPIETVTGIQGVSESVDPPNNNGYERTLLLTDISQAVNALLPFVDVNAAAKAGFDTTKTFPFVPFVPVLPTPLGDFHSFAG